MPTHNPNSTPPSLTDADIRSMIQLLGQVAIHSGTPSEKRKALMDGVSELIGADIWIWGLICEVKDDRPTAFSVFQRSGISDERFGLYLKALERPKINQLSAPLFRDAIREDRHITRNRSELDPNGLVYTDEFSEWRDLNMGPLILSYRPTSPSHGSCTGIYRNFDSEPFSERETYIAHLLLSELPWIHTDSWPNAPTKSLDALSPRLNTVFNLVLQGMSRKDIAHRLELSTHTINSYIRNIYRHFGVHSQAELIHRFVEGDGNRPPSN